MCCWDIAFTSEIRHRKPAGRHIWEAETRESLLASSSMFFKQYLSPNVLNHWDRPVIQKITFQRSAEEKTDTAVSQFDLVHCRSTLSFHRVSPRGRTPHCSQTPDETDHWHCRHYYWLLKLSLTEKKENQKNTKTFSLPHTFTGKSIELREDSLLWYHGGNCWLFGLPPVVWSLEKIADPPLRSTAEWVMAVCVCVCVCVCVSVRKYPCMCLRGRRCMKEEVFCMYEGAQLCVSSLKLRVCVCESTCMYIKKTQF